MSRQFSILKAVKSLKGSNDFVSSCEEELKSLMHQIDKIVMEREEQWEERLRRERRKTKELEQKVERCNQRLEEKERREDGLKRDLEHSLQEVARLKTINSYQDLLSQQKEKLNYNQPERDRPTASPQYSQVAEQVRETQGLVTQQADNIRMLLAQLNEQRERELRLVAENTAMQQVVKVCQSELEHCRAPRKDNDGICINELVEEMRKIGSRLSPTAGSKPGAEPYGSKGELTSQLYSPYVPDLSSPEIERQVHFLSSQLATTAADKFICEEKLSIQRLETRLQSYIQQLQPVTLD